jgi:hypothetical protein
MVDVTRVPGAVVALVVLDVSAKSALADTGDVVVDAFTCSEIVVVWVSDPLTPVIVTVAGPVDAVLLAVSVRVDVPVVDDGLNDAVTPLGRPLAESETEPVNPPAGATEIVDEVELPCVTEALEGLDESAKSEDVVVVAPLPMVSAIVAVCLSEPLVPVTVIVALPSLAVVLTEM